MIKSFKYRIYPGPGQRRKLEQTLESCRWLYNFFLAERKYAWEGEGRSVSRFDQHAKIPQLKTCKPSLLDNVQVLRSPADRVDLAFKSFFRRIKAKEAAGYPRFKKKGQYKSFTYNLLKNIKIKNNKLQLTRGFLIKIKLHRPLEGKPKICTVHKSPTGKWWVTFVCDIEEQIKLPENDLSVGLDLGLKTFAQLSDGSKIKNPRFFKKEEKELARIQRKINKKAAARVYERISFKRDNFCHQESRKFVNKYQFIAVEDLDKEQMLDKDNSTKSLRRSISDVCWGKFINLLEVKAEWAGRQVIKVNPAYTSQDCSTCGSRQKMPLSERSYRCPACGMVLDRDLNASLNILRLGLQSLSGVNTSALKVH